MPKTKYPLFYNPRTKTYSITGQKQRAVFKRLKAKGKSIFWGHIGCALWKPTEFTPKFKVGDVVRFFVGKCSIKGEHQELEWIRLAGIGRIFGFYNDGYFIKPMRYFITDEKHKNHPISLHHKWIHNAPAVFKNFREQIMLWSVS